MSATTTATDQNVTSARPERVRRDRCKGCQQLVARSEIQGRLCASCRPSSDDVPAPAPTAAPAPEPTPAPDVEQPASVADGLAQITARIGETAGTVRAQYIDWERFLQEGVLITLHHHRWGATLTLTLEQLGIQADTDAERESLLRIISPGQRHLLPKEILKAGKTKQDACRYWLERNAFRLNEGDGARTLLGWYVHDSRYQTWKQRNDELRDEYLAIGQYIYDHWDELLAQTTQDYNVLAMRTYNDLARSRPVQEGRVELPPLDEYIRTFIAEAFKSLPTKEEARDSYRYEWDIKWVPMAQTVARDQAAAQFEWQKSRDRAAAEVESEMMMDLRRQEARRASEGLERFVGDLQSQIQAEVYDVAVNALEAIEGGNGRLPGNSVRGLKTLVQTIQRLRFWDDPDMDARLAQLAQMTEVPAKQRDDTQLRAALTSLGASARLVLVELDRAPERSARDLGIPDEGEQLAQLATAPRAARTLDDAQPELPGVELEGRTVRSQRDVSELLAAALA
jgi:hypothetical protein